MGVFFGEGEERERSSCLRCYAFMVTGTLTHATDILKLCAFVMTGAHTLMHTGQIPVLNGMERVS